MLWSRKFAMPSPQTFQLPPVAALLDKYLVNTDTIIDPFSRDATRGTITNDLNPRTTAMFHLDATKFLDGLVGEVKADCVLFDPPYSPRQIAECYQQIGRSCTTEDTQNARLYKAVKDRLDTLLVPGGIAISFGWNSIGFGIGRGYTIIEILLVPHGAAHNDTICVVEHKGGQMKPAYGTVAMRVPA